VLDALREDGRFDDTLVIVTSDHGELLGEHDGRFSHGHTLHEQELRVPLVVKLPGPPRAQARSDEPLQLTDVPALVRGAIGLESPAPRASKSAFAEVYPLPGVSSLGQWKVWIDGRWKLHQGSEGASKLFDLESDPGEANDRVGDESDRARQMREALERFSASLDVPTRSDAAPREIDPETQRALEALGYVE
jgi:arylsulfatase A-like enzyme